MAIIPFGNRILVKRQKIGGKAGKENLIYLPDTTADRTTDIAEVIYVPEHSFADKAIIEKSESIILSLVEKAEKGDTEALASLLELNTFLKIKMIKPGDRVFIGTYSGINFHDNTSPDMQTIVREDEIIGLVEQ